MMATKLITTARAMLGFNYKIMILIIMMFQVIRQFNTMQQELENFTKRKNMILMEILFGTIIGMIL